MTALRFDTYRMPAASLGEESGLPDIHVNAYIRAPITVSERVRGEDAENIGKGMISTLLPYRIQDGYSRERQERDFVAAILENEGMRAVFLPELGGRLWSLYDKREGRELLYKNDVFQPANLALRNAWFSGGVEWNVGIKGHNPLTASPLFAARGENERGEPVLRMYEYERIRGVVYTIEAALGEDSLLVTVTIENTADSPTPMYWWSNIAVPEVPGMRVVAPAADTFFCAYSDGAYRLDKTAMPTVEGRDISYPDASPRSRDFFFDIPKASDKWVASVDREGRGLLHLSDPLLKGRKLFVWGTHGGGRHWNEWLTEGAGPYVEIQAGLAKTQLEHFMMPAHETITWQECYTALTVDPRAVHGEYADAVTAVAAVVREKRGRLDHGRTRPVLCEEAYLLGSGWGALEERLTGRRLSARCRFPAVIGEGEREWDALLRGERLPAHDPALPPPSYAVGDGWRALLEGYPERDFYLENLLGVMRYASGDYEGARAAFLASVAKEANAWAMRNLAMIEKHIDGNCAAAAARLAAAVSLLPDYLPLLSEYAETLLLAKDAAAWVKCYESLVPSLAAHGRLTMLYGAALCRVGRAREAAAVVTEALTVPDIKEGEYALSAIWCEIYTAILAEERGTAPERLSAEEVLAAYPLPHALDFRMH